MSKGHVLCQRPEVGDRDRLTESRKWPRWVFSSQCSSSSLVSQYIIHKHTSHIWHFHTHFHTHIYTHWVRERERETVDLCISPYPKSNICSNESSPRALGMFCKSMWCKPNCCSLENLWVNSGVLWTSVQVPAKKQEDWIRFNFANYSQLFNCWPWEDPSLLCSFLKLRYIHRLYDHIL